MAMYFTVYYSFWKFDHSFFALIYNVSRCLTKPPGIGISVFLFHIIIQINFNSLKL